MISNVGIIGGGQLGLMLTESLLKINCIKKIIIFSDKKEIPCNFLLPNSHIEIIYGSYDNQESFINFSNKCDIITYEFENIAIDLLKQSKTPIYPSINLLEIIQDKLIQKQFLREHNLPVGDFCAINDTQSLTKFVKKHNYPIVIKSRRGSFDGRGNQVINNDEELTIWVQENKNKIKNNYYVESFVDFENEISICGCLQKGEVHFFEPVINVHKQNILLTTTYKKENIPKNIKLKVNNIYQQICKLFATKGVICVEFFQTKQNIFINEIALRVHNSYHISLDCCNLSQFDLHNLSILDIPIPKLQFKCDGRMYNIISNMQTKENILTKVNNTENDKKKIIIKDYHKKHIGIRKVGHINVKL